MEKKQEIKKIFLEVFNEEAKKRTGLNEKEGTELFQLSKAKAEKIYSELQKAEAEKQEKTGAKK